VGPKVSGLTYKSRAKWKMLRGIYSDIYGEVNISVSVSVEIKGDYIEKIAKFFISVTLKSWSGRKLLDPPSCFSKAPQCLPLPGNKPPLLRQSYGGLMSGLHVGNVRSNCFHSLNGLTQCLIKERLKDGFGQCLQMA